MPVTIAVNGSSSRPKSERIAPLTCPPEISILPSELIEADRPALLSAVRKSLMLVALVKVTVVVILSELITSTFLLLFVIVIPSPKSFIRVSPFATVVVVTPTVCVKFPVF